MNVNGLLINRMDMESIKNKTGVSMKATSKMAMYTDKEKQV